MTDYEIIKLVVTYFAVGIVLIAAYAAGYYDARKEQERDDD